MYRITLKIKGMACSMCEAHMNDVIRRLIPNAKKVSSSRRRGVTEFLSEQPIERTVDRAALEKAIADTGYDLVDIECEPYEKKSLFFGR